MIELEVKDYCQGCPEFMADTINTTAYDGLGNAVIVDIKVKCAHRGKCAHIKKYLERVETNE